MDNSNQVLWAALIRSIIIALATGITAGVGALATGADDRTAFLIGLGTVASAIAARLGAEGLYDAHRAKTGNVQPSDVGRNVTVVNQPIQPDI